MVGRVAFERLRAPKQKILGFIGFDLTLSPTRALNRERTFEKSREGTLRLNCEVSR